MIAELVQTIAPDCKIETKLENNEYGFKIQLATSASWKFKLLFTNGLSKNEQKTDAKFDAFKQIELYFCLPDYWDLETDHWPVYWLNRVAEVPQKNDTWFGPGDTIPAGNPPILLTDRFPANHFMLVEPIKLDYLLKSTIFSENKIAFLGIIPISQLEVEYKIRNSGKVLLNKILKANYTEQVDIFREVVCRKRFLNFI